MIEVYCGDYFAKDERKIPYVMEIGTKTLRVKYDDGTGQREKVIMAKVDENRDVRWRLNRLSVSYQSPAQLRKLFEEYDGYASATFRYMTNIM